MRRFIVLLIFAASAIAQTSSSIARHTVWGTVLPTHCSPLTGDVFAVTSAGPAATYYNCTAVNTWTLAAGGGGSMTWPAGAGITVCTGTPCTAWGTSLAAPASAIVGLTDTQSLANKTLDGVTPATMAYLSTLPIATAGSNLFSTQNISLWTAAGVAVTSGISDPVSGTSAYRLTEDSSNSNHYVYLGATASAGATVLYTVYVRPGTGPNGRATTLLDISDGTELQAVYNLSTATVTGAQSGVTAAIVSSTNGYYKLTFQRTVPNATVSWAIISPSGVQYTSTYQGDGSSFLDVYQPSLQILSNTLVSTGQANIFGAFLQDFSASTVKIPTGAGFTASASSMFGYDSTATVPVFWSGGASHAMVYQGGPESLYLGAAIGNSPTSGAVLYGDSSGNLQNAAGVTRTGTGQLTHNAGAIGSTPTDAMILTNTVAAANNAQQFSPAIDQIGQGWVVLAAPAAPTTSAPTSGGACTNGTHYVLTTWLNATGETTMGAISAVQTCATSGNLQTLPVSVIANGPSGTTSKNVYMSKAGAAHAVYTDFFLACAASPCIADNSTTTFNIVLADASLGANPPSANGTGNSQTVSFRSFVTPLQGTTASGDFWGLYASTAGGSYSNLVSVLPNGNVGIGTTSPSQMLTVGASNNFTVTSGGAVKGSSFTTNNTLYGDQQITGTSAGTFKILGGNGSPGGQIDMAGGSAGTNPGTIIFRAGTGAGQQPIVGQFNPTNFTIPLAPTATANYGTLSIGGGPFDGSTTGHFVGSSSGTSIAGNEASGFGGNVLDLAVANVHAITVSAAGVLTLPAQAGNTAAAACFKAGGVIGYCSTVVGATGLCTCN